MRSHTRNSPQAAARIVALVLICDGHVCRSEVDALRALNAEAELGLPPGGFMPVVQGLCEDLLMGAGSSGPVFGGLDEPTLEALLDDVDQPELQRRLLRLMTALAAADAHGAEAEQLVLAAARRRWRLEEPQPVA